MVTEIHIDQRVKKLRLKAADRYNIAPQNCHIGHVVLQSMLEEPKRINQIDAVTGTSETNLDVATRSMRLASAMSNSGLRVGDHVVLLGYNHLDLAIPYYASHYNGYAICSVDPSITLDDLKALFRYISPKIVFCPKNKTIDVKDALEKNNHMDGHIVPFDDESYNMQSFVEKYKGTEIGFRPAEFDQSNTTCWLMLTSGTTGLPKVAIIQYDTLLNGLCSWWRDYTAKCELIMTMATIQWMSSLIFFISSPLMMCSRVQSSVPLTPPLLIGLINKYRPNVTAWTPYLLGQFITAAGDYCDLSCFKYIVIGGSAIEKPLYDLFKSKCDAFLYLVYGMTELLVPVFDFNIDTPFGAVGKPYNIYRYKLMNDDGEVTEPNQTGELWIKGDAFFKGYLNNAEETQKIITSDGWTRTGDIFYKDESDYYYFVERKRLLIKYTGFWISPLQLEDIIKKHPGVAQACVVGIPDRETTETPVAVIVKKQGHKVEPNEIFALVKAEMPDIKQLHGGLYFLEALPETPSGKIHRAKLRDYTLTANRIMSS